MGNIVMNMKETMRTNAMIGLTVLPALIISLGFLQPHEANAATISCSSGVSDCHFKVAVKDGTARNVPAGQFLGSHARHSGYSTGTKRQYLYACTKCHPSAGYTNAHQSGYKNITGSSLPGNRYSGGKKIANTNSPSFGNCSNIYCHSNGRASGMGQVQYSSSRWGGTETCLGCHGGRNGASGNYARSVGNFTLSTTHSQHLKYPAANVSCNECHSRTATDAATLKPFSGAVRHVNGVRDVTFASNATYGSYTSYKSTEVGSSANTKICSNTSCHGGRTRSAWSSITTNNDHTCSHCHGIAGTTSGTDLRAFAPGFRKKGTSTDQNYSSANRRVGSHFKHLSSAYMKNLKCNECHAVPPVSNPFGVSSHMGAQSRYNSQTLTFAQASSATILVGVSSGNLSYLSAFAGYTNGTATKAASCSSVYCHGWRLKNGESGGTYRKPYWNFTSMINYTAPAATVCARCHGYPPTSNSHSTSTTCSSCHNNISSADNKTFIDKTKHINGKLEAQGGHAFPYPGATHSVATGATNPSANCSCHDYTNAGTYPVAAGTAPNCKACHTVGLLRTVATSSCYDCHGASATDGTPNAGTTFPNWSGAHPAHVTRGGMTCNQCHATGGTGNTNHGNSNRTAKTRTTVNVSGSFTYVAATQTCSNVTGCHGTAVWSVTTMDCISCHGAALGARRAVTGEMGGSATTNSHHITSGTLTKWHCIICHAEGNPSTGGTTTLHKNSAVDLRNVDAVSTASNGGTAGTNYWSIPNTKTATDYTNIDTFCFRCHDSAGAAQIAWNGSALRYTGGTAPSAAEALTPFADSLTNSYDQVARTRVLDVDTQFTTTNYSHHAVKAAKYTGAGSLPFNSVAILQGGTLADNSRLHCHDCHYLNGHGTANNEYMLQNSSGADTLHTASSYVCLKCHTATYSTNAHTGGNGSDFVNTAGAVGIAARAGGKTNGNITGMSCAACHNVGGTGWGGIHGGNNTYTQGGGGSQSTYRFMPGMNNNGYTVTNWTAASSAISCYTNPTTNWGVCTSHTGGKGATVTRAGGARALSY